MKSELDSILSNLPRTAKIREMIAKGANAVVSIDHTGALCILMDNGELLKLEERKLGGLKADIDPLMYYDKGMPCENI